MKTKVILYISVFMVIIKGTSLFYNIYYDYFEVTYDEKCKELYNQLQKKHLYELGIESHKVKGFINRKCFITVKNINIKYPISIKGQLITKNNSLNTIDKVEINQIIQPKNNEVISIPLHDDTYKINSNIIIVLLKTNFSK